MSLVPKFIKIGKVFHNVGLIRNISEEITDNSRSIRVEVHGRYADGCNEYLFKIFKVPEKDISKSLDKLMKHLNKEEK